MNTSVYSVHSRIRSLSDVERRQVKRVSDSLIDNPSLNRMQNVFWIGVKAWAHVLLRHLRLNKRSKKAFSIRSLVGSPEMIENPVNMDAQ